MASPRSSVSDEIDLDLSASSSSFDEEEVPQYEDVEERPDEEPAQGNQPYQFEPLADEAEPMEPVPAPGDGGERAARAVRLDNIAWCLCGRCGPMPSEEECLCCHEVQEVDDRRAEQEGICCITQHDGFRPVCLNVHVLRVAYFQYRQQYGHREGHAVNEQYRYTAYRQFVRLCWGFLGRHVRVVLPACAVIRIREEFPSQEFAGFQYPTLG